MEENELGLRDRNPALYTLIVEGSSALAPCHVNNENYDIVKPEEDYPEIIRIPRESDPLRLKIREWRLMQGRNIPVSDKKPVFLSFAEAKKYQQERKKAEESLTIVNENYGNGKIDDSQKHLDSILGF